MHAKRKAAIRKLKTRQCFRRPGNACNEIRPGNERKKTEELLNILKENNISHLNDIEVDVFNSPFQFINRRNEITVTLSSDF